MKNSALIVLLALLAGGCNDDEVRRLEAVSDSQRAQMDQLLRAQQVALDQLSVQLGREAQTESESSAAERFNGLMPVALAVVSCALAVTLAVHVRKGRAHAQRPG